MNNVCPLYIPNPKAMDIIFTPLEQPDITLLEEPFRNIETNKYFKSACKLVGEGPLCKIDPGDFPHNIVEYYWIEKTKGRCTGYLECLCKLNTGHYARYLTEYEYGDDVDDYVMSMYISNTREGLFPYTEDLLQSILRKKKTA